MKREGELLGRNCSTGGKFETVGGAGNCEARTIKQTASEWIGNKSVSTYQLGLENSLKGEREAAVMILTFSRGANSKNMTITGEV